MDVVVFNCFGIFLDFNLCMHSGRKHFTAHEDDRHTVNTLAFSYFPWEILTLVVAMGTEHVRTRRTQQRSSTNVYT